MSPDTHHIGTPFLILQQVDSTNNYATALLHEGMAHHGTVVFAYEQTKGKGQRHKQWLSAKNENITLSIILQPSNLTISKAFLLSMSIAVTALRFFKKYEAKSFIKWPNDIILNDRKAGGILIENQFQGSEWKYSVVGIGLNINQMDFPGLKATSLAIATGQKFDILNLAKQLIDEVDRAYRQLITDPDSIREEYLQNLYGKNQQARLKKGNRTFDVEVLGVSDQGHLLTRHAIEEEFKVGEVEWIY